MSTNIMRHDVVQLDFDIGGSLKEIQRLQNDIQELKKKLTGDIDNGAFDDLRDDVNDTVKPMKKVKEQADKVTKSVTDIGKKAAKAAYSGLKKVAGVSFKALTVGVGAAAVAVTGLVTKSVQAYADFEQLQGGVQKLFGAGGQSLQDYAKSVGKSVGDAKKEYDQLITAENTVFKNANDAYRTAGLGANEYMETVTGFSASLISSLGGDTKQAASLADTAIRDMSDNANVFGTDMESVITVYQGLAKEQYMTLDNLKLGYGGTKEGAKQLVADAAKIDKSVKANDLSFGNMVKAIHAVQTKMGVLGTTEKEASKTVTGSLNAMKAAWGNMLTAIGSGENLDQCFENLIDSVETFFDNVAPVAERALLGLGTVIEKIVPKISAKIPELAEKFLPPLIKAAISLVKGLIKALPNIIKALATAVVDIFKNQFPIIGEIGNFFVKNANKIASAIKIIIPTVLALVAAFKGFKAVKSITSLFGGKSKGGEDGKDEKSGGLIESFKKLADLKTKTVLKGMANLGIILGGFIVVAAIFALVAPLIAKIGDFKAIVEVAAIMVILGLVGSVVSKAVMPLAKLKVTDVLKGMANMAIVLGGIGALTWILAKVFQSGIEFKEMAKVVLLIGVLGIFGGVLTIFAGIAGMIPISTVLLGLANIGIVLVGLGALLFILTKVFKSGINMKEVMQVITCITILGVLGAILTVFASIVGAIPVAVVVLGLVNMGIILAGLGALLWVFTKVFKSGVNFATIFKVIVLIGILGTVGSVLASFAGVIGMIPFPVVLAGLTNIGLVLGGITALIVAFGALTEIKGFTEFIEKGGEILVKIFNIIGKMVGSLVGGVLEGIAESLPAIGENLTAFAKAVEPMFAVFQGVDMSGLGAFFEALGGFMLKMTGNDIASFFTGGADYAAFGTELSNFATNAKGFFVAVSTLPAEGFSNAKLLFESIAEIGNVPNTGGVAQFFAGNNDLGALATGLKQLSDDGVISFYKKIAQIPAEAFNNAKAFFESLADIGNVPNTGGIGQWFSGENDYATISQNMPSLGSAMAQFYKNIEPITDISRISQFFEALGSVSNIPNTGGLGQWFSGENDIVGIGEDLSQFSEDAKGFFATINGLNLSNLNGLFDALLKVKGITADALSKVGDDVDAIAKKIIDLPNLMGDGLKKSGESLSTALVEIWTDAVKASVTPVNKVLDAANWILKEFGSKKKVISWQPYAKGTNGHKGGNALVNDGRGAELVQMPNGNAFIPNGKNIFIPNAPKGMKVLPADRTAQLMGHNSPTFNYAKGIGDIDLWSYYDNESGLVSKIAESVSYDGMSGFVLNVGKGMVSTFTGEMSAWIKKLFDECGGMSIDDYVPSKGVMQWRSTVVQALKMEGLYSIGNVARTLFQMYTESGGNPKAINLWDSNAKKGIPSKGLMQVIDPTFQAYARPGFNKNIYDPLSNILASIRYAVSRYGTLAKAYRGKGYANGGFTNKPSVFGEDGWEAAIPLSRSKRDRGVSLWAETGKMLGISTYTPERDSGNYTSKTVEHNTYAPHFELNISGTNDDRAMERKVKRWIAEAWKEMLDTCDSKSPQTQEV